MCLLPVPSGAVGRGDLGDIQGAKRMGSVGRARRLGAKSPQNAFGFPALSSFSALLARALSCACSGGRRRFRRKEGKS